MSWVNDLASSLGVPAGAATLAVAMYAACAAAENAARPEALKDIGTVLNDTSWLGSLRPSAIIGRVFVWTFGERHLSWKCFGISVVATTIFGSAILCVAVLSDWTRFFEFYYGFFGWGGIWSNPLAYGNRLAEFVFIGILADYISLLKPAISLDSSLVAIPRSARSPARFGIFWLRYSYLWLSQQRIPPSTALSKKPTMPMTKCIKAL